jgi:hypothetical protein
MVNQIAERLCIPAPHTYVTRDGGANALAFGKHTHSIVLTSGLVDMMSDRELEGIIAHEMGHILCQHMLYMDVGLALTSGAMPNFAKLIPGLEDSVYGLFFAWFRAAEYSADRAALLILEDPDPLARSLCRLAGVPRRFEEEFDMELFANQVHEYEAEAAGWLPKIVTLGMGLFLTHPEPARRVGAILKWAESEEYQIIREGNYLTKFEAEAEKEIEIPGIPSCPLCRRAVGQAAVCPKCGLHQDPRQQQRCPHPKQHVVGIDWKFCPACGSSIKQAARRSEIPAS